jgi:hypothetical protein
MTSAASPVGVRRTSSSIYTATTSSQVRGQHLAPAAGRTRNLIIRAIFAGGFGIVPHALPSASASVVQPVDDLVKGYAAGRFESLPRRSACARLAQVSHDGYHEGTKRKGKRQTRSR